MWAQPGGRGEAAAGGDSVDGLGGGLEQALSQTDPLAQQPLVQVAASGDDASVHPVAVDQLAEQKRPQLALLAQAEASRRPTARAAGRPAGPTGAG